MGFSGFLPITLLRARFEAALRWSGRAYEFWEAALLMNGGGYRVCRLTPDTRESARVCTGVAKERRDERTDRYGSVGRHAA